MIPGDRHSCVQEGASPTFKGEVISLTTDLFLTKCPTFGHYGEDAARGRLLDLPGLLLLPLQNIQELDPEQPNVRQQVPKRDQPGAGEQGPWQRVCGIVQEKANTLDLFICLLGGSNWQMRKCPLC